MSINAVEQNSQKGSALGGPLACCDSRLACYTLTGVFTDDRAAEVCSHCSSVVQLSLYDC